MRVGSVGKQPIGMLEHLGGSVAMQIETCHQWYLRPNGGAHPLEQLAFAIFEMFGDHGAVQIEIDSVEGRAASMPASSRVEKFSNASTVTCAEGTAPHQAIGFSVWPEARA